MNMYSYMIPTLIILFLLIAVVVGLIYLVLRLTVSKRVADDQNESGRTNNGFEDGSYASYQKTEEPKVKYCSHCGEAVKPHQVVCLNCGAQIKAKSENFGNISSRQLAGGLLGIFLGVWGVHNFYLGYTQKAVIQLLLGTVGIFLLIGPVISSIWGLIEGILILTGDIDKDGMGRPI